MQKLNDLSFLLPLFAVFLLLTSCRTGSFHSSVSLKETSFSHLPGWHNDDHMQYAMIAFKKSCPFLLKGNSNRTIGFGTRAKDWHGVCKKAMAHQFATPQEARRFFENNFRAYKIKYGSKDQGVFTGYYESELRGSLKRTDKYCHPIHTPPQDLICRGPSNECGCKSLWGGLRPHHTREAIHNGALEDQNLEIVWVDDPVEVFFLHIQGSARVVLEDGKIVRLRYAGSNGHPFVPIGRILLEKGQIKPKSMSMQSIRAWMAQNPKEAIKLMNKNPRYIFFRQFHGEGPLGCMGAPLTPERSLAVDRAFMPMGAPIWVNTAFAGNHFKIQKLFITQDTGSAIKGPIRGDIFWGYGKEAMNKAGRTKEMGEYYIFLPQ